MDISGWQCRVFGHHRDSSRVWNDQLDFRSRCKRCGIEMVRDLHGWREFDPDNDADPNRKERHTSHA
jgi:hypothetical protein